MLMEQRVPDGHSGRSGVPRGYTAIRCAPSTVAFLGGLPLWSTHVSLLIFPRFPGNRRLTGPLSICGFMNVAVHSLFFSL